MLMIILNNLIRKDLIPKNKNTSHIYIFKVIPFYKIFSHLLFILFVKTNFFVIFIFIFEIVTLNNIFKYFFCFFRIEL